MQRFAVCIENEGYEVSLELRKLYELLPDEDAAKHKQLRIIDESGEDYLFPSHMFMEIPLSKEIADKVAKIA